MYCSQTAKPDCAQTANSIKWSLFSSRSFAYNKMFRHYANNWTSFIHPRLACCCSGCKVSLVSFLCLQRKNAPCMPSGIFVSINLAQVTPCLFRISGSHVEMSTDTICITAQGLYTLEETCCLVRLEPWSFPSCGLRPLLLEVKVEDLQAITINTPGPKPRMLTRYLVLRCRMHVFRNCLSRSPPPA